jgi:hypothetical protein
MISQLQWVPSHTTFDARRTMETAPRHASTLGRLLQAVLALWLLPALMIVLVVGTIGMLILASTQVFPSIVAWQACHPRNAAGLESFRC